MDLYIDISKGQTEGFCPDCLRMTNHILLYSTDDVLIHENEDEKDKEIEEERFYNTIKCKGCDNISFALLSRTEKKVNKQGKFLFEYTAYPDPLDDFDDADNFDGFPAGFLEDYDIRKLPKIVKIPYEALVEVFDLSGARILSGIALRLIIESISIEQKIPGRNLKEKIDNMHTKGVISKNDLQILHSIREIGNVSAHEIKEPKDSVLDLALEIINHMLKTIYFLPELHKKMTAKNQKTNILKSKKNKP